MACPYLGRRLSLENIAVSRSAAGGDSRACTMTEPEDGKGSDQGIYPKSHRLVTCARDESAETTPTSTETTQYLAWGVGSPRGTFPT